MRLTQGTFSYLPDLTDDQITKQIAYAVSQNYSVSIEYTDDPHPRNAYWDMLKIILVESRVVHYHLLFKDLLLSQDSHYSVKK